MAVFALHALTPFETSHLPWVFCVFTHVRVCQSDNTSKQEMTAVVPGAARLMFAGV